MRSFVPAVMFLVAALPASAFAQDDGGGDSGGDTGDSGGGVTVVQVPGTTTTTQTVPYGVPGPEGVDTHLPSSSRSSTDTSSSADGFDLLRQPGSGKTIKGGSGGAYVVSGQYVPETHTAKRGDTLWDISKRYFGNAYNWPRIWSYNRQIENPHWIYPGDHIQA